MTKKTVKNQKKTGTGKKTKQAKQLKAKLTKKKVKTKSFSHAKKMVKGKGKKKVKVKKILKEKKVVKAKSVGKVTGKVSGKKIFGKGKAEKTGPGKGIEKEKTGEVKKEEVKVEEFKAEVPKDKKVALKSFSIVFHPLITEKSIGMIESENKLVFVVDKNSNKASVKEAIENLYKIKVDHVNILRDLKGRKRAFVKINKKFRADEIATKLGVL